MLKSSGRLVVALFHWCVLILFQQTSFVLLTFHQPRRTAEDENAPTEFNRSMLAMLESQLAKGHSLLAIERATASTGPSRPRAVTNGSTAPPENDAGRLKHSPRCENLAVYAQPPPGPDHGSSIRPPWTPPPSPGPGEYKNLSTDELRAEGGILSGRR
jgi:hypothetical protein